MSTSKIMQVLYEAAVRGNQRGAKHGALLFDRHGILVSVGWNHKYSLSKKHSAHKVIHAEVHALAPGSAGQIWQLSPVTGSKFAQSLDFAKYTKNKQKAYVLYVVQ